MDRRNFIKVIGTVGACSLAKGLKAEVTEENRKEFVGVLCDTTRCIGCRSCEIACSEVNGNYVPDILNDKALERERTTSEKQWTVVNRYKTEKGDIYVKKQC